jgi:hypothetical protein
MIACRSASIAMSDEAIEGVIVKIGSNPEG